VEILDLQEALCIRNAITETLDSNPTESQIDGLAAARSEFYEHEYDRL
jgi:hypothetical protein